MPLQEILYEIKTKINAEMIRTFSMLLILHYNANGKISSDNKCFFFKLSCPLIMEPTEELERGRALLLGGQKGLRDKNQESQRILRIKVKQDLLWDYIDRIPRIAYDFVCGQPR